MGQTRIVSLRHATPDRTINGGSIWSSIAKHLHVLPNASGGWRQSILSLRATLVLGSILLAMLMLPAASADVNIPCRGATSFALDDGSRIFEGVCTNVFDPSDPVYPCTPPRVSPDGKIEVFLP